MKSLRASLHALQLQTRPTLRIPATAQIARVAATFSGPGSKSLTSGLNKNYDLVAAELLARATTTGELTRREAQDAAWCLWETKPALSSHAKVVTAIVRAAEKSHRKQPFRALASSYLASYAPARHAIAQIGQLLAKQASQMGAPWQDLQRDLSLFHPQDGPKALARAAIERKESPTQILESYGLGALNAQSGLAGHCVVEALRQMRDDRTRDHDGRLQWVKSVALREDGDLIFEEHAPLVADALMLPFSETTPADKISDKFLDLLLRLFGDPRIHPERWVRMTDSAKIVRRWLTKQTLRQFLEVVDQVADDRMWKHRRAFWGAVYDRGLISDAWVVFGQAGTDAARRTYGEDIAFATFDSGTGDSDHSVLLLRIGRGVVAEWSHNGRCIIWRDADAPGAPRLHLPNYAPPSLRAAKRASSDGPGDIFSIAHMNADQYVWQGRVAAELAEMTGERLEPEVYRVRKGE